MSESVVILAPDHGSEQDVKGSDLRTPLNFQALLNPFAVLKWSILSHYVLVSIICRLTWFTIESMMWIKGS